MSVARSYSPVEDWESKVSTESRALFWEALGDEAYQRLPTFRDQCSYLFDRYPTLSCNQIGLFFGIDRKGVWKQRQKLEATPKERGRPPLLIPEQAASLVSFITRCFEKNDPATVSDALNYLWENFGLDILPNSLRKWLNRHTAFETRQASAMEDERLSVHIDSIDAYFRKLQSLLTDVPASFVFNLDESGFQRYVDQRHSTVIVPKTCDMVHFPVSRREKRATFVAVVAADGTTVKPLIITPRLTIEAELLLAGYSEDIAVYAHSDKGFITEELFYRYIADVFVPEVCVKRCRLGYSGKAVLIMDNCHCHKSERVLECLEHAGVETVFLPAHSSDQTQALDVGLFGNMKSAQARIHPPAEMTRQSQQIIRMISAFIASCHPLAITGAFRRAGISGFIKDGRVYCEVTRHTASCVRNAPQEWQDCQPRDSNKLRIELATGLWGSRADQWLRRLGVDIEADLRIMDLPNIPNQLIVVEEPTKLAQTIQELWDGEVPSEDEESDEDWKETPEIERPRMVTPTPNQWGAWPTFSPSFGENNPMTCNQNSHAVPPVLTPCWHGNWTPIGQWPVFARPMEPPNTFRSPGSGPPGFPP